MKRAIVLLVIAAAGLGLACGSGDSSSSSSSGTTSRSSGSSTTSSGSTTTSTSSGASDKGKLGDKCPDCGSGNWCDTVGKGSGCGDGLHCLGLQGIGDTTCTKTCTTRADCGDLACAKVFNGNVDKGMWCSKD